MRQTWAFECFREKGDDSWFVWHRALSEVLVSVGQHSVYDSSSYRLSFYKRLHHTSPWSSLHSNQNINPPTPKALLHCEPFRAAKLIHIWSNCIFLCLFCRRRAETVLRFTCKASGNDEFDIIYFLMSRFNMSRTRSDEMHAEHERKKVFMTCRVDWIAKSHFALFYGTLRVWMSCLDKSARDKSEGCPRM